MKQKFLLFFLCVILFGCQSGSRQSKTGDLPIIDLSQNHPQKEIHLRNIADIEYVPLETTDNVLLNDQAKLFYVSDKYLLISNRREGDVFVFYRNGKIVSHFNRRGGGSGEYPGISNIVFDETNEEIFIFHNFSSSRIWVYSLHGEHKRTLNIPEEISKMTAYNFDAETLLIYDESGLEHGEYNESPYMFLSKRDGNLSSVLNIKLPVRYSNMIFTNVTNASGQQAIRPLMIGAPNNRNDGQNFVIADISSDTIFQLSKNKDLVPLFIRKPSVHSSEPRIVWTSQLKTDKFILLWKIILDFVALGNNQNTSLYTSLIYNFETEQTNIVSFVNDDFPSRAWIIDADGLDTPKNITAGLINVVLLKDAYEEKQLRGDLEKLVTTLDEDDNPVVMIVKFR
jgi:hypothetical protein